MQPKILPRRILFVVALAGFTLSLVLLVYFIPGRTIQIGSALLSENVVVSSEQEQASVGLPVRLKIPEINVDAAVEHVGLTPDGDMDVPKSQDDVAWYELGQRPGEIGSAVIAGHYGWRGGEPSAFDNLYTLRNGDTVYVEDDKGVIISFVVRESRRYDPNADASAVFDSQDGKSHLNLVTCEGAWDEASQSYSTRLVVFTDKE